MVGALGILTGARSSGIVPFAAGLFAFMILSHKRSISIRKILKNIVITSVTFYSLYAFFYVPNVLNGNIQGGNSLQLKATENPYNPINLLMVGRSDAIIPFLAFFDKPLTGWGYMTKDPNKKYYRMELKISNRKERNLKSDYREQTIPAHSAWGYYSCSYGIVVFIAMFLMLLQLWKYVLLSLVNSDKYLLYRLWAVLSVTWNFLFSPMSHFKWSLPTTIAIILVLSTTAIKEYVNNNFLSNETKNFSNNPNFRKS